MLHRLWGPGDCELAEFPGSSLSVQAEPCSFSGDVPCMNFHWVIKGGCDFNTLANIGDNLSKGRHFTLIPMAWWLSGCLQEKVPYLPF